MSGCGDSRKIQRSVSTKNEKSELFNYKVDRSHILDQAFNSILEEALSKLPDKVVDWALHNLLFVGEHFNAYYIPKKLLRMKLGSRKGIVIISVVLESMSKEKRIFTIAHEMAHAKLNVSWIMQPNL